MFQYRSMLPEIRLLKKPKSIPRLRVIVVSHLRSALFLVLAISIISSRSPSNQGYLEPASAIAHVVYCMPEGIRLLPAVPNDKRSLRLEIAFESLRNFSSDTRHARAAEGKYPHLLFLPKRLEPSARIVNVARYLSAIV